ncbi:MAG: hypothetical protein AMS27_09835 [Bacteroides sp. SM23_62_1]|nr:MAG: hypothetical protein AMS27_09835 [Bacteroides sp. SM23_62_1]
MKIIRIILVISFFFISRGLYAQELDTEEVIKTLDEQIEELTDISDAIYGKDIRLVNGRVYFQPNISAAGNPFFKDPAGMTGSVTVRGTTFTGIKLNYDIFQDYLLLIDEFENGGIMKLVLNKNHTTAFTLEEHQFILLDPSTGINIPEKQYFEVLFSGKIDLVQRHEKIIEALAHQEYPYGRYTDDNITRFILKDNQLHKFKNRFTLYRILADGKSELKKYRRKNSVRNVKNATDQQITGMIEHYNSIIP